MAKKHNQETAENLIDELDREVAQEASAQDAPAGESLPEIPAGAGIKELELLEQSRPIYRPICKMHNAWMVSNGTHLHFTYYKCPIEGCTSSAKVPRKTPSQVISQGGERGFEAR